MISDDAPKSLELENISRRFGNTYAVRELSLSIAPGEVICLVGHSGCGKTSLLRIIAGIDTADRGVIRIRGEYVAGPSRFVEPEMRNIGFVFQDYALFPHLTVEQNVLFGLRNLPRQDARTKAMAMIARVGLTHLTSRHPHMLSGGEQQRVALARALAPGTDILLMDEPFSNLDRGLREQMRDDTLSLLRSMGTTVVMVTHDPEEALSAGDRVVLMRAGEIVQQGSGYELFHSPNSRYAADFFTAFNKVQGIYRNGQIHTPIGAFPSARQLREESQAVAYIRPSDITVTTAQSGLSGRIVQRVLLGEIEQLAVKLDGLEEPICVRSLDHRPPDTGEVGISIRSEAVLTFPNP
ncbi:ABC transporter ATP-binding protein [Rhizobium sp. Root1220]|uniref:ABC transporter ATP-binding protein n=1 Tax=Rhizobium sp. Root1220 TaxID=1736432 RepID=UPI000AA8D038|nr:ABC transporter ATP-binding protein [Rhizobium sp. Root1220]